MAGKKQDIKLGKVQHRIMEVLWERGEATARDISDVVAESEGVSHSTVQTLLRKLERKGAVRHEDRDRVFYFFPVAERRDVTASSTREFLNRVFEGSASRLVSHLLEHEHITAEELENLRRKIEAFEEKAK
jgi:predicted transcriptional regulator